MPMDGITLGFIARELSETLCNGRIDKIGQPERDELQLFIRNQGANHQLLISASANNARTHLTRMKKSNPMEPPMFCMLLRKHLIGGRVVKIEQIDGDRILEFHIESMDELGDRTVKRLVCEFMGKHSNLMLVNANGRILDSARHVTEEISRVRDVLPGLPYERPPAHGKLPYDSISSSELEARLSGFSGTLDKALSASVSGLSAQTARELVYRATGRELVYASEISIANVSARIAQTLQDLPALFEPAMLTDDEEVPVDVVAFPYLSRAGLGVRRMRTLSEAFDEFYQARDGYDRIKQKSSTLHRVLKNNIERCEKKLALQNDALEDSARMEEYRVKGELLTASMHMAVKGQKYVELPNYYDEECANIRIELDEKLSPGQNAQRYFKLYQKARSAQKLAAEYKKKTLEELDYLEGQFDNLLKCVEEAELIEIREELERYGYVRANHNRRDMKKLPPSKPFHFASSEGIDILVGKNNLQNDKLTQSASPNDMWMHAKDMPGSHVIVLSDHPGAETLKEAAILAAYFSKGRTSSQVPVDMTLRKYVKKPSGAKPGFVIYTRQRTLYVTPEESFIRRLEVR